SKIHLLRLVAPPIIPRAAGPGPGGPGGGQTDRLGSTAAAAARLLGRLQEQRRCAPRGRPGPAADHARLDVPRAAVRRPLRGAGHRRQRASGVGYDGHTFWDAETFALPMLTYTVPSAARDHLTWRRNTLTQARERAEELGLAGAAFPWRTITGKECSGYWPAGTAAFHVNAAAAAAITRYVAATGDSEFEAHTGTEILIETARLWISLGHYDDGSFHIDGVTGPDEYTAIVDDNVYTNAMAQANLRSAAEACERHREVAAGLDVTEEELLAWRTAADAMTFPFDEHLGVHAQAEDFTSQDEWKF